MTESVLSTSQQAKSNRLDPPHDLLSAASDDPPASGVGASANPWMAYAGRDPEYTTQQVDRQASELMAYVQEQNKEIDVRQAELNAKLAQLDNQLRNARLRSVDDLGTDLLATEDPRRPKSESMLDSGLNLEQYAGNESMSDNAEPEPEPEMVHDGFAVADLGYVQEEVTARVSHFHSAHQSTVPTSQEFEEVERIVAQFTDTNLENDEAAIEDLWNHDADAQLDELGDQPEATLSQPDIVAADAVDVEVGPVADSVPEHAPQLSQAPNQQLSSDVDAFPGLLSGSHLRRVDRVDLGPASSIETERRLLAERQLELDRQKSVLSRMQEETQSLHREALEMRIVTEQLWAQLSDSTPPEKLTELIASLRNRLNQQYSQEQTTLEERKHELLALQKLLEEKQAALREQSGRMQDWFASRQEEIKSYANEVDAREMLLDRREHRLQDEFAKWEAQRKAYEQQLHGLVHKLQLNGVST